MRLTTRRTVGERGMSRFIRLSENSSNWNGFNRFQKWALQIPEIEPFFSFLRNISILIVLTLDGFRSKISNLKKLKNE